MTMTEQEYNEETTQLRPALVRQAEAVLRSRDDAEDTVQDVMLRLWNMRSQLRSPMAPLARVLVRNFCVDRLRRRVPTLAVDSLPLPMPQQEDSAHARAGRMLHAIATLPPMQQTVLRLHHMEELPTREIARLLGCSDEAVRQVLSRGRRAVLRLYTQEEVE